MAVDFPNSPNTGQVFTEGNISWRYNGYAWQRIPDPGEKGQPGIKGTKGDIGPQGPIGNFGGATFQYQFNSATDDSDPGDGKLKLSSGTVSSATKLFIDDKDGGDTNTDIQPFLRTIADSTSTIKGHFRISNKNIADDFALFTISAIEEATGYFKVTCAHVSGSASSFDNNEDIIITFARTGDQGQKGDQGIQGIPGTPINYDLEVTNGTTTISLKGSNGTTDNVQLVGSGAVTITRDSATQLTITGTNTQKSEEEIEDIVGGMIDTTTGITVTYDDNDSGGDGAGKLNFVNTIDDFTDLNDTPANYTGQAHKFVRVNKPDATNNDGNGLEFATPLNTTYALSATQKDDGTNPGSPSANDDDPFLFLDGSSGTDSHIQIKGSGTVSVARNSTGDEITISGSDTNVNTQYSISVEAGDDASAEKLRLSGTNSVDDDVLFKAGTGLAISKQTSGADLIQYDGTYELHALATGSPATASDPEIALMSDNTSAVTNGSIQLIGEGGVTVTRNGTTEIKINGSGAGTNTTYSIKASQADDGTNPDSGSTPNNDPFLFLDASQGSDAHIQLKGSGSAKVTRNADDEITISSTTYTLGTADGDTGTEEKITLSVSGGGDTTADNVILVAGTGLSIARDTTSGKITFTNTDTGSGSNNTFAGLTDTPANYTGHAHKLVRVNKNGSTSDGTGLEFIEEKDYTLPVSGTDTGAGSFGSGEAILTLTETQGSSVTTDPVKIKAGSNINLDIDSANGEFTISAKDTNTQIPDTTYDILVVQTGSPPNNSDPAIKLNASSGTDTEVQLAAVDYSGLTISRGDDETINFNTSLLLEARSSTSTATDTANPNLTLATSTSSSVPVLDTVKFIGGDNISVARNTNSNEITISSSATIDITQLNLNRIRFGPGSAANDDANIEWLGGSNDGYLRISTSDDGGAEYIELGDYDNTNIGGAFTQWMKLNRSELTMESKVRTKDDLYIDEGLRDGGGDIGTSGQVLTSTGSKTNWVNASTVGGSVDTKYDLLVPANTTKIRLEGNTESGNVNDDVEIAAGTNITVTRDSANKLTIASSATLTGTIDKANQIKVNESPGNSANSTYHNLTYVANSTGGNHQTLLMDDETSRLSWNPYLERLIAYGVWSYRMIQWSNGSFGSPGQVLTSQGDQNSWTWTTPSSGLSIGNESSSTYRNLVFIDSSSASSLKTNDNNRLQVRSSDGAVKVAGDITAFASDIRLKTEIKPIENAVAKLLKLNGFTYEFNELAGSLGYELNGERYSGVSAQDVKEVLPEAVKLAPINEEYMTVQYEKLVPLLIEAIKELKGEIEDLKRN